MATLLALWLAKRGNGRNSKTKHRFDKIFGTDAKWMCVYKTMSPDSGLFFFFKFELRRKITWLAGAWLPWQPTTQVWLAYDISFISYIRSRV